MSNNLDYDTIVPEEEPKEDLGFEDVEEQFFPKAEEEDDIPFVLAPEDEDLPNLVPLYQSTNKGKEFLKKLVQYCHDEFKTSWDKNKTYREKTAQIWRLLYCDLPPKDKPYENCANAAIPLMLQNMVRYTNKIDTEVFGDWSGVFNFIPTNPKSEVIAPIVTEHSNWQIRTQIPGFKRQMRRALLQFFVTGDVVCHSYFDEVTNRNVHEMLTCDDFVIPYTHVSVADDLSDVPWLARRRPMFKSQLRKLKDKWSNIDKVLAHTPPEYGEGQAETELRDTVADHQGEDSFGQQRGEYEIIHYEGWLKLLGTDKEKYCQIIFDLGSQTCLKLTVHEHVDYNERYRYQFQTGEAQEYQMAVMQREQMIQMNQMQGLQQIEASIDAPPGDPVGHAIADAGREQLAMPPPPEPPMPSWMKVPGQMPEPPKKTPIHMFAHGVCLEPMLGNMGIGVGRIDAQLNLATNTLWSQFLDAATLGNGKTFITAGNVDFKSPFRIGPGVVNKAKNVMPSDLQNSFIDLNFGQANPQLIEAAAHMMAFGEQAASTPDLMSGAPGKSGETARGIQARMDQINAIFQVPAQKFAEFAVQVCKNNCKLNRTFMKEWEVFYVNRFNDDFNMNSAEMIKVSRDFYDNEFEIGLNTDLQFKSRAQKVAEADEITQLPNAMMELGQNWAFKYHAIKRSLEARGLHRLARQLLGPPPPKPITTFGLPPNVPGISIETPQGVIANPVIPQMPMPPPDGQAPAPEMTSNQNTQQQDQQNMQETPPQEQ